MKKKLLFVLFAVLTLAVGATAATSSAIERTGKSIKKERTAPAHQVAKADADKSPTVYGCSASNGNSTSTVDGSPALKRQTPYCWSLGACST